MFSEAHAILSIKMENKEALKEELTGEQFQAKAAWQVTAYDAKEATEKAAETEEKYQEATR